VHLLLLKRDPTHKSWVVTYILYGISLFSVPNGEIKYQNSKQPSRNSAVGVSMAIHYHNGK